jgi:uncharacterized protein (DUF1800 family)
MGTIREGPWAPYEPSTQDPWDLRKVAHLHRRAGFGATWDELQRDLRAGLTASVNRLLDPPAVAASETQALDSLREGVLSSNELRRLKAWWLYRMMFHPDPLREKMTLFWHGHFATSVDKVRSIALMLRQNELLRRHALEEFAPLLTEMIGDPAMLIWLDGGDSPRERPNENFAREFLELFTLGVGNYTEADIRQAARAFTGWVRERPGPSPGVGGRPTIPSFQFVPRRFDDGEKTFLRQTGAWRSADIVRITLEQCTAAEFLVRKLYRFFISESAEPGADLLQPLAEELRTHRYSIRHVLGIVLRSRHFYAQAARRQRIKSPVDFCVGLARSLDVPRANLRLIVLATACDAQGQELFAPPNVKGWDGGRTWLTSTSVLERGNWSNDMVWGNPDVTMPSYDPLAWAQRSNIAPERAMETLQDLVLQGDLDPRNRVLIVRAARGASGDSLRRALQLLLHCPECQLS